ncbi:MAG: hypothetical protein CR967_00720 [Proteobacteria bacterium]|nr:MAG: hypothetical protein CR967_00720 [Pseudomonadota bacterium]
MEAWIRKSSLFLVYLASFLLILVIIVTVLNIGAFGLDKLTRMFGYNVEGLAGYEDFVKLCISSIALMFFPWTQYERGHVSVDFFADKLSNKIQIYLDKIWLIVTFFFVLFLAYFMFLGMLEAREDDAMSSILGWSIWPFYVPGIISLILWAIIIFYQVLFKRSALNDG